MPEDLFPSPFPSEIEVMRGEGSRSSSIVSRASVARRSTRGGLLDLEEELPAYEEQV